MAKRLYCYLAFRHKVVTSKVSYHRETVYGFYSTYKKAVDDINEMKQYCKDKGYILEGYAIFHEGTGEILHRYGAVPFKANNPNQEKHIARTIVNKK